MKLFYLLPVRFPSERAHAIQVAQMCSTFSQSGVCVQLLVPSRKGMPSDDLYKYYNVPNSFKVRYISSLPWGVSSRIGFWTNLIMYTLRAVLFALLNKTDVVYSRDEYVLYFLSLFSGKKLVWESHEAKYNFAARSLLNRGVKCVAISEGIKEFYIEQGVDENQILVAHDGIDESFFGEVESKEEARKRLGIATDKPVAMYMGGLDTWKGVKTFFDASKYNEDVHFVVIGGRAEEVEKYKKEYPQIQFLGQRPYNESKDNQQAADVLVVPNTKKNELSAKYTSPLKLFTHLASKVPLIVSDIPSMRNVVSEKHATFFIPDDARDLATKIDQVLTDREVSKTKTEAAYELSKRYTWKRRAEYIVAFLRDASEQ